MADISQVKIPGVSSAYNIKDEDSRTIANWNTKNGVKNILDISKKTSEEVSEVNFTIAYTSGAIIATGIATANVTFYFENSDALLERITPGETYILSGCSGGSTSTYYIEISYKRGGSTVTRIQQVNNEVQFTVPSDISEISASICVTSGTQVNHQWFRPMLRLAKVTDSEFIPFADNNLSLTRKVRNIEKDIEIINLEQMFALDTDTVTEDLARGQNIYINRINDWGITIDGGSYSTLKTKPSSTINVLPPARPMVFRDVIGHNEFCAYTIGNGIYHIKGNLSGEGRFNLDFRLATLCSYNENGTLCIGNSAAFTHSETVTFLKEDGTNAFSYNPSTQDYRTNTTPSTSIFTTLRLTLVRGVDYDIDLSPQLTNKTVTSTPTFSPYYFQATIRSIPDPGLNSQLDTIILLPNVGPAKYSGETLGTLNFATFEYKDQVINFAYPNKVITMTHCYLPMLRYVPGNSKFFLKVEDNWWPAGIGIEGY